jgi:hypothetical protein
MNTQEKQAAEAAKAKGAKNATVVEWFSKATGALWRAIEWKVSRAYSVQTWQCYDPPTPLNILQNEINQFLK